MTLDIILPEQNSKDKSIKDLVFSILAEGTPKTVTQLHREIKKRYGLSVTFQAVMKAVKVLLEKNVLSREKTIYKINIEWIFETRIFIDKLYRTHFHVQEPIKKSEVNKDITTYTVTNLLELDSLWNDILTNWAKDENSDKINVWSGKHCWWLIPRLQEEDLLHDLFSKKRIKTYNLILSNTLLDKTSVNYYKAKHENVKIAKNTKEPDIHISAFGDFVLKFEISDEISRQLEKIYEKTKKIENLNLKEVLDVFKLKSEIEIIMIKDKLYAEKIKEDIIRQF